MRTYATILLLGVTTACGQAPADSGATSEAGEASTGGTGAPTSGAPTTGTSTTGTSTTASEGTSEGTSGGSTSSGEAGTTTTGETTGTTGGEASSSGEASSTGDGLCDPGEVLDAVSYNYVKTVDVGIEGVAAGYYNPVDDELVFLANTGAGVRLALDGSPLGDVTAPAAVSSDLDGAVYDPSTHTALLVDRDCNLAEVDPVTLEEISVEAIDVVKFQIGICSAIALGYDGNLYVANVMADEVVVLSRDLTSELGRFDVQLKGINSIDGITLIPGSEYLLVHSNVPPVAAIFDRYGEVIVPISDIGGPTAPLVGGVMPSSPDGLFTVCSNGQVWLCGGLQTADCYKYAPEGGGGDVCGCLLPP